MKKIFIYSLLFITLAQKISAQELLATVKINSPKIQNTDVKVFRTLESQLVEFLNNTKWTDDTFEPEERIKLNITINIDKETDGTTFEAVINIQATRPVYGTDTETPILNHSDDRITFNYEQYQPIQFTRNSNLDRLTAIFSFYAYYVLGLDYDTFSSLGGESYFQIAQEIVRAAPQVEGWVPGSVNRNRYWMMENTLSPRMRNFREAQYTYHRLGLDTFTKNREDAQNKIILALDEINRANSGYPNAMIIQMFVVAKSNEIIEMAKGFNKPLKLKTFDVMTKIDPANITKYQQIGLDY
ncbi:MAG: DUF4835 family protein [Saprospiraceae bacterium]